MNKLSGKTKERRRDNQFRQESNTGRTVPELWRRVSSGRSVRCLIGVAMAVPGLLLLSDGFMAYQTTSQVLSERSQQGVSAAHSQVQWVREAQLVLLNRFGNLMPSAQLLTAGKSFDSATKDFLHIIVGHVPALMQALVLDDNGTVVFSQGPGAVPIGTDLGQTALFTKAQAATTPREILGVEKIDGRFALVAIQKRFDSYGRQNGFVLAKTFGIPLQHINVMLGVPQIDVFAPVLLAPSAEAVAASFQQALLNLPSSGIRMLIRPHVLALASADVAEGVTAVQRIGSQDLFVVAHFPDTVFRSVWFRMVRMHLTVAVPGFLLMLVSGAVAVRQLRRSEAQAEQEAKAERLQQGAEQAMWKAHRMEAFSRMAGHLAGDFRNLLTVVNGNTELLQKRVDARGRRMTDNILRATGQGEVLITQLLSFSRRHPLEPRVVELGEYLGELQPLLVSSLGRNIVFSLQVADDLWPVEVDPVELQTAILNMAVNAAEAMPDGGSFQIDAENRTVRRGEFNQDSRVAGDFVLLRLADNGNGMPPDVLHQAFEPFFSTKNSRLASGLGLSQVYGFAMQSGGTVEVQSVVDGGTTVSLLLPRSRYLALPRRQSGTSTPHKATRPHAATSLAVQGVRVLMVDDNPDVAEITAEMLRDLGYEVEVVDSGRKALECIGERGLDVDMVIADLVMPDGIDGLELSQEARRRNPRLPILLVTGYVEAAMEASGVETVLLKPVTQAVLAEAVRDILNAPHLPRGVTSSSLAPPSMS